jgi:hypothetical protein
MVRHCEYITGLEKIYDLRVDALYSLMSQSTDRSVTIIIIYTDMEVCAIYKYWTWSFWEIHSLLDALCMFVSFSQVSIGLFPRFPLQPLTDLS